MRYVHQAANSYLVGAAYEYELIQLGGEKAEGRSLPMRIRQGRGVRLPTHSCTFLYDVPYTPTGSPLGFYPLALEWLESFRVTALIYFAVLSPCDFIFPHSTLVVVIFFFHLISWFTKGNAEMKETSECSPFPTDRSLPWTISN